MSADPHDQHSGIEIERKYLLRGMPAIPEGAEVLRVDQGYLSAALPSSPAAEHRGFEWGRLRRTVFPDGAVVCNHTMKSGRGLVRKEIERPISDEQFNRHWPRTENRRLIKTRYQVAEGEFIWEIDVFDGIDLALAEVELPTPDAHVEIPNWLQPYIVREVTDDPAYSNSAIAARINHV